MEARKAIDLEDRNGNRRGMDADSDGTPEADMTDRNHKIKIDTKHDEKPVLSTSPIVK